MSQSEPLVHKMTFVMPAPPWKVSVVITGINQWNDYTAPFIESVMKYEPEVEILVIDNGSKKPYPESTEYKLYRYEKTVCYAQALNAGCILSKGAWLMLFNNDALCEGKFIDKVTNLKRDSIYGDEVRYKPNIFKSGLDVTYLHGWMYVMHRNVYDRVGMFDENYERAGGEDIDYSMAAREVGINLKVMELPFRHLEKHSRAKIKGHKEAMLRNQEYFKRKWK